MNTRITLTFAAALLVPVLIASTAFAVDEPAPTTTTTQKPTTTPAPLTDEQKRLMQERIQKRKDALKLRLTTAQQNRLKDRCKNAQGKIQSEQSKVNGIETSRAKVHANVLSHLTKLETKLAAQGLNTTELKVQITVLQTKIATFNTDLVEYKAAVSDLAAMDCVADPVGFKSSLEATRTARKKLREDAVAVHTYIKETIKPTLATLRAQLEKPATTEGTN